MLSITQLHDEIDEAIKDADIRRIDDRTGVKVETLMRWRTVVARISELIVPYSKGKPL